MRKYYPLFNRLSSPFNSTPSPSTTFNFPTSSSSSSIAAPLPPPSAFPPSSPPLYPVFTERTRRSKGKKGKNHSLAETKDDHLGPRHAAVIASLTRFAAFVPRVASYNVASLSQYATSAPGLARKAKVGQTLRDFINHADIICVQETNLAAIDQTALSSLPGCAVSRNNFKMGVAGTLIIDTPAVLRWYSPEDVKLPTCCRGYVQCRRYTPKAASGHPPFLLFNCYFYTGQDKEAVQLGLIEAMMSVKGGLDTLFVGDFNFIRRCEDSSSTAPSLASAAFLTKFDELCEHFDVAEVKHDEHTCFRYTKDAADTWSRSARLDRFYAPSHMGLSPLFTPCVSTPAHSTNYTPPALNCIRACFSDHLPIILAFATTNEEDKKSKSIPRWLAASSSFAEGMKAAWKPPTRNYEPFVMLRKYKKAMFKTASMVRRKKIEDNSFLLNYSHHFCLLRLVTRTAQDCPRIEHLLSIAPHLTSLVALNHGRYVDSGLETAMRELVMRANDSKDPPTRPNPISSLKDSLPASRSTIPHLRCATSDAPIFDAPGKARVAADYWSRVWAPRRHAPARSCRASYLAEYTKRVNASDLSPPSLRDVQDCLCRTGNTAAGPDGIPFAAWRAFPDGAAPLLHDALWCMLKGQPPPDGFNHGLLFLLPKKDTGLISDTRPLSVTNTDNRVLASVMARSLMPAVIDLVDPSQKGFLWGKNGSDHTVDINSWFFEGVKRADQRLLFLLDTAKAFDSIDHDWILQTLTNAGFPEWVIAFVRGSLSNVRVAPFFGAAPSIWIDILRGVKQGCPLSPILFLIAYDPLLSRLRSMTRVRCYAFADDLALAVSRLADIPAILITVDSFSEVSGLGVNKDKSCVISSGPESGWDDIRIFLSEGPWPELPLRASATHLGIPIGRKITLGDIFAKPYDKAVHRVASCASAVRALSVPARVLFVNVFITSLFSYHCLFFILPKEFLDSIRRLVCKLVIPFNGAAYTYDSLICWTSLFSIKPSLKDLWAYNVALLASRSTFIHSTSNYWDLPSLEVVYNKSITNHRDAAAIDFWEGRHSDDGTLIAPPDASSPSLYRILVQDVYLEDAAEHLGVKMRKFLTSKGSLDLPEAQDCINNLARNLAHVKHVPRRFLAFHFSLVNNAVATARRMRHQNYQGRAQVAKCSYCAIAEDSIEHWLGRCVVVLSARASIFALEGAAAVKDTLSHSYLIFPDTSPLVSAVTLAFNFAVWKCKDIAFSSRDERNNQFRVSRLVELAEVFLAQCRRPVRKLTNGDGFDSISAHEALVEKTSRDTLFVYTDGSATPNPGPAGAGVAVFDQTSETVVDIGLALGQGTNNLGEIAALCLALGHIGGLDRGLPVLVFTDSLYALNAVTKPRSKKKLSSRNEPWIVRARSLLNIAARRCPSLSFHWVKGHSLVGGNERADRIAKSCSKLSKNMNACSPAGAPSIVKTSCWPFGLKDVPLSCFLRGGFACTDDALDNKHND